MNPIICPLRNGLQLTKAAHKTFLAQDIPVDILYIDNASDDGTAQWLRSVDCFVINNGRPLSVAQSWNQGLAWWFSRGAEYVLVVNNDLELPHYFYRKLIEDGGEFVTGVGVDDKGVLDHEDANPKGNRPHPHFSAYLIRRSVWEKVGPFDEGFKGAFCEDWDYHVRMQKAGVHAYCIDVSFYHVGSSTMKNMDKGDQEWLHKCAIANRAYFKKKWGMEGGSPEYYALFNSSAPS